MKLSVIHNPERAAQRYKVVDRALVWCHKDAEALPYHLNDISCDGLSFRYLGPELDHAHITRVSLYHERELIVDSAPVELVTDFILEDNPVPVRRANLQFGELTNEQSRQLERFIENYTRVD